MTVPYTFGTATSAIPLSQLDSNFNTPITLGNTAIQLGNTVTTLNNMTLANVTITSGTANITANVTLGNANAVVYTNASNVATTSTALTFDGSNLGIAVTPSAWGGGTKALQVGALASYWSYSTNAATYVGNNYYFNGTNRIYLATQAAAEYYQGAGEHRWYSAPSGTAGTTATFTQTMTLDVSGNLLVGATSQLIGTGATISTAGRTSTCTLAIQAHNGAGYNARIYLEVPGVNSGTIVYERATSRLYASSQTENSGPYVAANGTSWTTNSDARLKTNVQDISYGLAAVMALVPKKYAYKNNEEKQCLGFIAQDVVGVIPEIVDTPKDADAMMGIEYQAMIPVLVKALQELKAEVDSLKAQLEAK